MTDEKLSAKPSIDTTDFKTGIAEMNREMRVLESGFRASTASLGDWGNTATGLESRIKTLTSTMDIQRQKVEATRVEYERIKAEKGENSRAAQELEIKLNKETETLGKMENELKTTETSLEGMKKDTDNAGNSVDTLGDKTAETGNKMETFKSILGGVGTVVKTTISVVLAMIVAVVAATAAIGGLVYKSSEAADAIATLAGQTGMTTDKIQELAYIGSQLDVSTETMTGAFSKMTRSMGTAQDEIEKYNQAVAKALKDGKGIEDIKLGSAADAYKQLGVSVVDSSGKLRDNKVVFGEVVDALGKISNPTERDVLAMQLLGKSAMELNPLFAAGADEMARLGEEAQKNGAVALPASVQALDKLSDSFAGLKLSAQGVGMNIAAMFAPFGQGLIDKAQGYMAQLNKIVTSSGGDTGKMTTGVTGLVAQIAKDIAANAPQMLTAGLAIVKSILDAIISALPSMLTAGIEILKSLVTFIVSALPSLLDAGIQILLFLVDALIQNLPMLIDAALQAIITLANGLSAALPTLIPAIVQAIITIVNTLIANLPMLITAAMTLILALAQGLIQALPILIAAIPQIVNALMGGLMASMPLFLNIAGQILGTLSAGVVANLFVIIAAIGKLIAVVVENLAKLPGKALEAGKNFVQGLINGITSGASALFDTVSNLISNMLDTATGPQGIHAQSPSKKGRAIGANFGGSLGLGVMDMMREVENAVIAVTGRMSVAAGGATGAGLGGNSSVSSEHYTFLAPVTIGAGARSLGETVKAKRF